MMKRNWMAQWKNLLQNNGFVNPMRFPMLCEKSGTLHLAELGLTAGWLAGQQTKYRYTSKFLNSLDRNIILFATFNEDAALLQH